MCYFFCVFSFKMYGINLPVTTGHTRKRKSTVKNTKKLTFEEMIELLLNDVTSDELPLLAGAAVVGGNDDNEWHDLIGEMNDFDFFDLQIIDTSAGKWTSI